MVIFGGAVGGDRRVMLIFELKSPVMSVLDVVGTPGLNSHVDTAVHDPLRLWVIWVAVHWSRLRILLLNTELLASDAASTQVSIVIG